MSKSFVIAAATTLALAACAPASKEAEDITQASEEQTAKTRLTEVLAASVRDDDRARDQFRHPG